MTPRRVPAAVQRNWPGILAILLAFASVALYWLGTVVPPPNPSSATDLGQSLVSMFQLASATSALVGFLAVLRARRGAAGLATAIIGLLLGGTLTLLWVVYIGGLMLFPGAIGGD